MLCMHAAHACMDQRRSASRWVHDAPVQCHEVSTKYRDTAVKASKASRCFFLHVLWNLLADFRSWCLFKGVPCHVVTCTC